MIVGLLAGLLIGLGIWGGPIKLWTFRLALIGTGAGIVHSMTYGYASIDTIGINLGLGISIGVGFSVIGAVIDVVKKIKSS